MPLPGQTFTSSGTSNLIFGSNVPPDFSSNTVNNVPAIQQLVKKAGVTLLRTAIQDNVPDSEIDRRANACAACGSLMLVILPHNDITFSSHVITRLGSKCNLYELSNEPDLNGISWQQYLSFWNAQIPTFRSLNPNAAFIGPVLGVTANFNSYLQPWLAGTKTAGTLPDGVSFHEYPCFGDSQSACAAKAGNFAHDINTLRTLVTNTVGHALPICLTEWNIDPTHAPSYVFDPNFVTPWYKTALDSMVSANLDMGCQFCAASGDTSRDMISTATFQPNVEYQPFADEITKYLGTSSGGGGGGGGGGGNLVGPDTPGGITQGSKNNAPLNGSLLSDMKIMGLRWLRWQPYANSIELSQGQYTWGALDSVVMQCNAAGVNLIPTVLFPPPWGQITGPSGSAVPSPQWTLAFAMAMCNRYDGNHGVGRIQGIELGNEDYGFPDDAQALANTMNFCYGPIKTAHPALIVGPGSALHRNPGKITPWFQTLWSQAKGHFGYANFHYYCQNNNSPDPSVDGGSAFVSYPHLLSLMQSAASAAGSSNFPIWITETGWPVNCNGGFASNYVVSQQTQWDYYKYLMDQSRALTNQPIKIFFYTLSYLNIPPTCGVGTSLGMSTYQGIHGQNGFPTIAYQQIQSYNMNWGGGSGGGGGGGGPTQSTRDWSARARVRIGTNTSTHDLAVRANIKIFGTIAFKDLAVRAPISGAIFDTFVRANQPHWLTATDGESWTQAAGNATPSIVSNEGQVTGGTSANVMRLGIQTLADVEASVRVSVSATGDSVGITLRDQGLTTFFRLSLTTAQLQILQQTPAGGVSILKSYAFAYIANTFYWLKFRVIGAALYGKIWADGSLEPTIWLIQTTSTGVAGAGQVGLFCQLALASDIAKFDSFQATTAAFFPPPPTVTPRDVIARVNILGRKTTQTSDVAARARLIDGVLTSSTYAAKRSPLDRQFPKS